MHTIVFHSFKNKNEIQTFMHIIFCSDRFYFSEKMNVLFPAIKKIYMQE